MMSNTDIDFFYGVFGDHLVDGTLVSFIAIRGSITECDTL